MGLRLDSGTFLGRASRPRSVASFLLQESRYRPGEEIPAHSHEHAHFCLVLEGGYHERVGRRVNPTSTDRGPASLAWLPAEVDHAERHYAGGRHFHVEVSRELARQLSPDPAALFGDAVWLAQRLWVETATGADPVLVEALAHDLFGASLHESARRAGRPPAWLDEVDEALRAHFVHPPRVTELAEQAGVHPVHLSRTYRRHRGLSIADAVRSLRVTEALRRLERGDRLADVASAVGFADQSHLTRSFKRLTGLPPGRWARLLRS